MTIRVQLQKKKKRKIKNSGRKPQEVQHQEKLPVMK
jgi:hypothetical protein